VSLAYSAEAVESTDNSPTLAQPSITTQRVIGFIPFSIELSQDWGQIVPELTAALSDGKDVLDATAFLTGTGTNQPGGVLNIGGTGGLTTTQRVLTTTTAVYALGDPYLLKAALPARFINNATYVAAPGVWDTTYRFVGGNSTEPFQMPTRGGEMLGRPKVELSTMSTGVTTSGQKIMMLGDFKAGYLIADRLGMQVELIPHLVGATNRFPTGQRGLVAIWRTGGGVVAANALRYLEVKLWRGVLASRRPHRSSSRTTARPSSFMPATYSHRHMRPSRSTANSSSPRFRSKGPPKHRARRRSGERRGWGRGLSFSSGPRSPRERRGVIGAGTRRPAPIRPETLLASRPSRCGCAHGVARASVLAIPNGLARTQFEVNC